MQKQQIETELQGLITEGKKQGYLTIDRVNKVIPSEMSPDALEEVLLKLDEAGIELVDEAEAEERAAEEQEAEEEAAAPAATERFGGGVTSELARREIGADAQTLNPAEAIRLCRQYIMSATAG